MEEYKGKLLLFYLLSFVSSFVSMVVLGLGCGRQQFGKASGHSGVSICF